MDVCIVHVYSFSREVYTFPVALAHSHTHVYTIHTCITMVYVDLEPSRAKREGKPPFGSKLHPSQSALQREKEWNMKVISCLSIFVKLTFAKHGDTKRYNIILWHFVTEKNNAEKYNERHNKKCANVIK